MVLLVLRFEFGLDLVMSRVRPWGLVGQEVHRVVHFPEGVSKRSFWYVPANALVNATQPDQLPRTNTADICPYSPQSIPATGIPS